MGCNWRILRTINPIGGTILSPVMSLVGAPLFGWHRFPQQQHVVVPILAKEENISAFLGVYWEFGFLWWYVKLVPQ